MARYVQTCCNEVKAQTACRGQIAKWQIALFRVMHMHSREGQGKVGVSHKDMGGDAPHYAPNYVFGGMYKNRL